MTGIINFDKIYGLVYTEKTNKQVADDSKYCFKVAKTATKKEVASLVKKLYSVTVKKVNIINTPEKTKRFKGSYDIYFGFILGAYEFRAFVRKNIKKRNRYKRSDSKR